MEIKTILKLLILTVLLNSCAGDSENLFLDEPEGTSPVITIPGERNPKKGFGVTTDLVLGDKSASYIEEHQHEPYFMYLSYNAVHTPMESKQVHLEKYKDHPRKKMASMTWSFDENIGKLIDKLKKNQTIRSYLNFLFK